MSNYRFRRCLHGTASNVLVYIEKCFMNESLVRCLHMQEVIRINQTGVKVIYVPR